MIYFDPTPLEVHRRAGTWLPTDAQDIYNYIKNNLNRFKNANLRAYYNARQVKLAGLDWKRYLEESEFDSVRPIDVVLELEQSKQYTTVSSVSGSFMKGRDGSERRTSI